MICSICRSSAIRSGSATVSLELDGCIIMVKRVPADVSANRDEYYISDDVAAKVLDRAENAVKSGAEVEIVRFAA